jgi:hypothetical protein
MAKQLADLAARVDALEIENKVLRGIVDRLPQVEDARIRVAMEERTRQRAIAEQAKKRPPREFVVLTLEASKSGERPRSNDFERFVPRPDANGHVNDYAHEILLLRGSALALPKNLYEKYLKADERLREYVNDSRITVRAATAEENRRHDEDHAVTQRYNGLKGASAT